MAPRAKSRLIDKRQKEIQLDLNTPGMTALHRMGVAGLWMTLQQLEETDSSSTQRAGNLSWSLSAKSVHICWQGADYDALNWLLEQAFQIDDQGLISFIGLNPISLDFQTKFVNHACLLNTFLQHNKFCQKGDKHTEEIVLGNRPVFLQYAEVNSYAHQSFATHLCDESGNLTNEHIPISGWLYPGAVVRHARFGDKTKFEESPELAFALLFAPIACRIYLLLPTLKRKTVQFALVTPQLTNLESFAQARWNHNTAAESLYAQSGEEAGLKYLANLALYQPLEQNEVRDCEVTIFGKADWAKQQKTRLDVTKVRGTLKSLEEYQLIRNCFNAPNSSNKQVDSAQQSYAHAIALNNISKGLAWWNGLFERTQKLDEFQGVFRKRKELFKMVENTQFEDQSHIFFIKACHEAFKKTYAKLYDRASEGQYVGIDQKNLRIRSELNRCKDAKSFRHFLSDFLARSGTNSVLETHWEELLPLLTGMTDWKVSRDLFLLSMASYPSIEGAEKRRTQQQQDNSSSD